MRHGRTRKDDFLKIQDKAACKLASWKGMLLNKLGRVTLAKAVLTSLPAYNANLLISLVCLRNSR